MAAATSQNKKGFEFRMSKKVAELTQVVHMLFSRNHEKEVELEATKEAYEHEIEMVIKDARSKIERLEARIDSLEKEKTRENERLQQEMQDGLGSREKEWAIRLEQVEGALQEEKVESQSSRDMLIQARKDMESLRDGHSKEATRLRTDTDAKLKDMDRLKARVAELERSMSDKENQLSSKGDLLRTHEKLRKDVEKLRFQLDAADREKETLSDTVKQLEMELKNVRREAIRKLAEKNSAKYRQEGRDVPNAGFVDYNEEVDRLRKEVARYRMELYNRENNFNRMFTEKQPVHVGAGAARSRGSRTPQDPHASGELVQVRYTTAGGAGGGMRDALAVARERTFAQPSMASYNYDDEDIRELATTPTPRDLYAATKSNTVIISSSTRDSSGRLPQLNMDSRARLQRLVKPRPLPKEMLTGKSAH